MSHNPIPKALSNLMSDQYHFALPDENVIQIFSNCEIGDEMSDLALVCKHWYAKIVPSICLAQLNERVVLKAKEMNTYIKRLCDQPNPLDFVFSCCQNLRGLNLSDAYSGNYSPLQQDKILAILSSVKKHCPQFVDLNLSACFAVNEKILVFIKDNFTKLTHLNLSQCRYYPTNPATLMSGVIAAMKELVVLDVSGIAIGDRGMMAIGDHCPNLMELNMYQSCGGASCHSVSDLAMVNLAIKCKSLTRLILSDCDAITDLSLDALAKNCKDLSFFFHYYSKGMVGPGITQEGLRNLKLQLPNLKVSGHLDDLFGKQRNEIAKITIEFPEDEEEWSFSDSALD